VEVSCLCLSCVRQDSHFIQRCSSQSLGNSSRKQPVPWVSKGLLEHTFKEGGRLHSALIFDPSWSQMSRRMCEATYVH
jgi:hypothetical protein